MEAGDLLRFLRLSQDPNGCWEWPGAKSDTGYGSFRLNGQAQQVHRISHEIFIGSIPDGFQIDHLCRNRACWNPAHLEAVTPAENTRRGEPHQRTHCPHGHPYSPDNTWTPQGTDRRFCRTCHRDRERQAKQAGRRSA